MHMVRPALALDPRRFGRRFVLREARPVSSPRYSDDLKLFATTFAAGFLFVSLLIA
jgi:hypothetical protein